LMPDSPKERNTGVSSLRSEGQKRQNPPGAKDSAFSR
jgi:hypothetical protein